ELSDNTLGTASEELTNRCVVEEGVGLTVGGQLLLCSNRRREGTRGVELLHLLLGLGQPGSELGSLFLVLRVRSNGEERTTPVGSATREHVREVPASGGVAAA